MKWIFFIFLFLSSRLFCQTDLVPNEGFEVSNVYLSGGAIGIGTQFAPFYAVSNGTYTVLLTDVNEMQLTRIKIVILK
jgi:hypothetical protein